MENLNTPDNRKLLQKLATACMMLTLAIGCGGPTEGRMTVTGTVTIDGTPLPNGTVTFYKGSASSGVGVINDGTFTVSQSAGTTGMQPGTYQVAIESWETEPGEVNEAGEIGGAGVSRIPEKYNSAGTSELVAEVSVENSDVPLFLVTD